VNEPCPSLFRRLIDPNHPESPQLLTVLLASAVLLGSLAALVAACVRGIRHHNDLGSGACWALAIAVLGLFAMAAIKPPQIPNVGAVVPSAPDAVREPSVDRGTSIDTHKEA
jgi:ABC-type Na+ efflux pump permease subunit